MIFRQTHWFFCTSLALALPVNAQSLTGEAAIDVSANVVETISVLGVRPLNFGDVVAQGSATTKVVGKADGNAGQFEVTGADSQAIQVSYVAPPALQRASGSGSLPVSLTLYSAPTVSGAGGAIRVLNQDTVTLQDGRYFFFVAGALTVRSASQNPPGTYTGEFELTVSYTTI